LVDAPTGARLTYAELGERVERVSALLAERGFGPGDVLALQAPNVPVAVVVPRGDVGGGDLMAWLNERVASHKRLHEVRFADSLPRTPAGKLLRRALAQPSYA
jgi:acyl-coenzyme A synthetase/AMP-(fatty) acid ligase